MSTPPATTATPSCYVSITNVSRRLGLTCRALRYYEAQGLILAHRERDARVYDQQTIRTLASIAALRAVGLSIATIRQVLNPTAAPNSQIGALRASLERMRVEHQEQVEKIDALLATSLSIDALSGHHSRVPQEANDGDFLDARPSRSAG